MRITKKFLKSEEGGRILSDALSLQKVNLDLLEVSIRDLMNRHRVRMFKLTGVWELCEFALAGINSHEQLTKFIVRVLSEGRESTDPYQHLKLLDVVCGAFGVEHVEFNFGRGYYELVSYLNAGESYATTITLRRGNFYLESWGDLAEHFPTRPGG